MGLVSYKTKQKDGSWKTVFGPFKCDVAGVCESLKLQYMRIVAGNVMACCPHPDHDDRDPSFGVSLATGDFMCQGCGYRGSLVRLIREIENCTAQKAIWLAQNASAQKFRGAEYTDDPRKKRTRIYRESFIDKMEINHEYLESRGIPGWAQDDWKIRYSWDDNRVYVPVRWHKGEIVGFDRLADEGLRRLGRQKSLYTPRLPTGSMVNGLDVIEGSWVVLVEGTIDMLKVYAALKRRNVGMIFGSSFNDRQAKFLLRAGVTKVGCMFDNDEQGEKAFKELDGHLGKRINVRRIKYKGSDPGSMELQDIYKSVIKSMK